MGLPNFYNRIAYCLVVHHVDKASVLRGNLYSCIIDWFVLHIGQKKGKKWKYTICTYFELLKKETI